MVARVINRPKQREQRTLDADARGIVDGGRSGGEDVGLCGMGVE